MKIYREEEKLKEIIEFLDKEVNGICGKMTGMYCDCDSTSYAEYIMKIIKRGPQYYEQQFLKDKVDMKARHAREWEELNERHREVLR